MSGKLIFGNFAPCARSNQHNRRDIKTLYLRIGDNESDDACDCIDAYRKIGSLASDVGGKTGANAGDVLAALTEAKAQGKHNVLMRVKTVATIKFVAIPLSRAAYGACRLSGLFVSRHVSLPTDGQF
jgi:hypothetical protein